MNYIINIVYGRSGVRDGVNTSVFVVYVVGICHVDTATYGISVTAEIQGNTRCYGLLY